MFAIVQAAGWPIWFLLFASVVAVALIIERSVSLRASKIIPPQLLDQVVVQRAGRAHRASERERTKLELVRFRRVALSGIFVLKQARLR